MEDQEALQPGTLVSQLTDTIQNQIDNLLADRVMTTGVVVGGIFLPSDQLFRMEQLAISTSAYLICSDQYTKMALYSRTQILVIILLFFEAGLQISIVKFIY